MRAISRHALTATLAAGLGLVAAAAVAAPKVVVISLDGAKPELVKRFIKLGVLDRDGGLATLKRRGIVAEQNITATPSVTAVSHIAIATGSTAVHNNIAGNTFHPVAATIGSSISGFAAPIGGYQISPIGPSPVPGAEPLWVQLRNAGRKVATATWPGSDGADIRISGNLVQGAVPPRTTDYTVPFGAFGGLSAQGFEMSAGDFGTAPDALVTELVAAALTFYGAVKVTTLPVETVFCAPTTGSTCGTTDASGRTLKYEIKAAALDTTNDGFANYDTLVFFEAGAGIASGPLTLPATGPAYAKLGGRSAKFFFTGSGNQVGAAYFVSHLAPDLSTIRFARYAASFIPRNAPVLNVVDDINSHVGFWAPQPDFRIPERISPGFTNFPDLELETMYEDQVASFTDYQTRIGLRAIERNPDADLVMIYLEQPDGSGHQFMLTDWRQPTDFTDARTIGWPDVPPGAIGRDWAKVARYAEYLRFAYRTVDEAVLRIVQAVGTSKNGEPRSDVFVVSDHGMAPFHTAVSLAALLTSAGVDTSKLGIRTTGPATNIYVNLSGRQAGGAVSPAEYEGLVKQVADLLREAVDSNPYYNPKRRKLFSHVWTRPFNCGASNPGLCTSQDIGQDSGDVVALLIEGYNFDGTQTPQPVMRLGDESATPFSVPNFYGAHGHDSKLPSMSAILYAAGPSLKNGKQVRVVRNIDIAPTIMRILGVTPAATVDGKVIPGILERRHRDAH